MSDLLSALVCVSFVHALMPYNIRNYSETTDVGTERCINTKLCFFFVVVVLGFNIWLDFPVQSEIHCLGTVIWYFLHVPFHVTHNFSQVPSTLLLLLVHPYHKEKKGLSGLIRFSPHCIHDVLHKNSLMYWCVCKCVNVSHWLSSYYCCMLYFWSISSA